MTPWPEHLRGRTFHGRKSAVANAFSYGVDFLLVDMDSPAGPPVFSRNRFNLFSIDDRNHGGAPKAGVGLDWARQVFRDRGFPVDAGRSIRLLTQPSLLGFVFNPVSFWLLMQGDALIAAIAEVNNTYGDRHSYVCARPDGKPIGATDEMAAEKVFHVSPFQEPGGSYSFRFRVTPTAIDIRIRLTRGMDVLIATFSGRRQPATTFGLLGAALRRPFGALRVLGLIHWQALKLKLKGARFVARPLPPQDEVS